MAHFALLDENNIVVNVIKVDNADCVDENGEETEDIGVKFCESLIPGTWIQTSYNSTFRKNYAGIGYTYDKERDAFIPPRNFQSWILDQELCVWTPPIQMPENGKWSWDEETVSWVEVEENPT